MGRKGNGPEIPVLLHDLSKHGWQAALLMSEVICGENRVKVSGWMAGSQPGGFLGGNPGEVFPGTRIHAWYICPYQVVVCTLAVDALSQI